MASPSRDMASLPAIGATPTWLPGETAYSWICRYHALNGNRLCGQTSLALFGAMRRGSQHDFPTHLEELSARTNFALGSAEEWALERTILPYYLHLRGAQDARAALSMMAKGSKGMLKFRLGILTSRFRAHHPLKACPRCMAEQREQCGVAYWLLAHQYPGVWVCLKHHVLLQQCALKATGVGRFSFILPRETDLFDVGPSSANASLLRLATISACFAQLPWDRHLAIDVLARTYLSAVLELGVAASEIRSAPKVLGQHFLEALEPLKVVPELRGFPATTQEAFNQLSRWLLRPRGGTHPLRHLSIIFWLFPSWEAFWSRYQEVEARPLQRLPEAAAPTRSEDPRRVALLRDLREGCSATKAARDHGVDVKTAQAWAASAGFHPQRRPKVLKEQALRRLVAALQRGADKRASAQQLSVSVETVTNVLRTEPGLSTRWRAARLEAARTSARTAYADAIRSHPGSGVKTIRAVVPSAYAWLYRNDRAWLASTNVDVRTLHSDAPRRQRVDWNKRDRELRDELLRAAARAPAQAAGQQHIFEAVPELRAKQRSMRRLPLTKALLEDLTHLRSR